MFKIEGFQDIKRSVTDQDSEVGARSVPAFATPRDHPLVGVQALISSAKQFQKLLDSQYTPFDPPPPILRQVPVLGFSAILLSVPFEGAFKKWSFSTLDKVKNTPLDKFLDQM